MAVFLLEGGRKVVTRFTKPEELPQWLTVAEFRNFFNLGRSQAYDLIRQGSVPHRKFGRIVRIPREAIVEWQK